MKKQAAVTGLMLTFVLGFPVFSYAGKVELTTYYPAPYGEYTELKATGQTANNSDIALEAKGNTAETGLVVTNANQVGIGTSAPAGKLDVILPNRTDWDADAQHVIFGPGALNASSHRQGLRFGYNATNRYGTIDVLSPNVAWGDLILTSGAGSNVGIGTTTPNAKLAVAGKIISTTKAQHRVTTKANLKNYHSSCDALNTGFDFLICNSACSRYCRALDYSGGTLVEWGATEAHCDCIP